MAENSFSPLATMNIHQPCFIHSIFLNSSDLAVIQGTIEKIRVMLEFKSIAPLNPATLTSDKFENPTKIFPIGTYSGLNVLLNVGVINRRAVFTFLFSSPVNIENLDQARDFWMEKFESMQSLIKNLGKHYKDFHLGDCVSFVAFGQNESAITQAIADMLDTKNFLRATHYGGEWTEFVDEQQEYRFFVVAAQPANKAQTVQNIFRSYPSLQVYILFLDTQEKRLKAVRGQIDKVRQSVDATVKNLNRTAAKGELSVAPAQMKSFVVELEVLFENWRKFGTLDTELSEQFNHFKGNINKNLKNPDFDCPFFKHYLERFEGGIKQFQQVMSPVKDLVEKGYQIVQACLFQKDFPGPMVIELMLLQALKEGALPDSDKRAIAELTKMFKIDQDSLGDLIAMAKALPREEAKKYLEELKTNTGYKESINRAFATKSLFGQHKEVKDLLQKTFAFNDEELKTIFTALVENAEKQPKPAAKNYETPPLRTPIADKDFTTLPPLPSSGPTDEYKTVPPSPSTAKKPPHAFDPAADDDDDIPVLLGASKPKAASSPVAAAPLESHAPAAKKNAPPPPSGGPSSEGYFGSGVFTITPDYFLDLAKGEIRQKHYDAAKDLLKRACQMDPNHSASKLYLGLCYVMINEVDKAIFNLEAVKDNPQFKDLANFFLGYGFLLQKKIPEADAALKNSDLHKIEIEYLADVVHLYNENGKQARSEQICTEVLNPAKLAERFPTRYENVKVLGSGGMGVVYKAHDKTLNIDVALKLIRPEWAKDKELLSSMLAEAQLMAKVGRHPNIISIYDIQSEGIPYIIMEYISGTDLRTFINKNANIPQEKILRLVKQIFEGLAFVHDFGSNPIIHRDIKPENIMLDEKGVVHIMDLGLAQFGSKSEDNPNVVGTPAYMSPEQWQGMSLDARTDIYAVGIILYEMVTGTIPFMGTFFRKIVSEPDSPKTLVPNLPADWEEFIQKCIAKDRDKRFKTTREAVEMFLKLKPFSS